MRVDRFTGPARSPSERPVGADVETRPEPADWQGGVDLRVPGLTVLWHADAARAGERAPLPELASGREVALSRLSPAFSAPGAGGGRAPRPLDDPYLSRSPVRLAPGGEGVRLLTGEGKIRVAADGEVVAAERLFARAELERGVVLLLNDRVVLLLHLLPPLQPKGVPAFGLVGESAPMVRLRREVQRVADLDVAVLLRGETGTGKELVAEALHAASPRRDRPFLAVNMGAVPPTLAASELFGAARGAYTGSVQRQTGYFTRAHTGTLFLDEIGEAPAEVQVLLLRVLETREIQMVGAELPQKVDVRLIAATDADLEAAIGTGRFRAPLLHRLSGYEITVPTLRERREDFGRLLVHFLRQELEAVGEARRLDASNDEAPWLPAALVARLALYEWPGNVRQLRNVARQIAIGARGDSRVQLGPTLERLLADSAPATAGEKPAAAAAGSPRKAYRKPEEVTEEEILAALLENRWRLKPTADRLGVSRTTLYALIDRCSSIRKAGDLGREEIAECLARCGGDLDAAVEELCVSKYGLQLRIRELGL